MGYNEKRNKVMDYPYPVTKDFVALMIPKPTVQDSNIAATIWKPFQFKVRFYIHID